MKIYSIWSIGHLTSGDEHLSTQGSGMVSEEGEGRAREDAFSLARPAYIPSHQL